MPAFTYDTAVAIASLAHDGQTDKAGRPYIEHPLRVAARVDYDPTLASIAVLHDVIEDTADDPRPWTAERLRAAGAPERVVAAVVALTHPRGEPNVVYWARVKANPDARAVKLADIADNTSPARLAVLDDATRERLLAKYERAVATLVA